MSEFIFILYSLIYYLNKHVYNWSVSLYILRLKGQISNSRTCKVFMCLGTTSPKAGIVCKCQTVNIIILNCNLLNLRQLSVGKLFKKKPVSEDYLNLE
jgi:hypothetical protein